MIKPKLFLVFLLLWQLLASELAHSTNYVEKSALYLAANAVTGLFDNFKDIYYESIAILGSDKIVLVDNGSILPSPLSDSEFNDLKTASGSFTTITKDSTSVLVFTETVASLNDGTVTIVSPVFTGSFTKGDSEKLMECIFTEVVSLPSGTDADVLSTLQNDCSVATNDEIIGFRESTGEIIYSSLDSSNHGMSLTSFQLGRFVDSFGNIKNTAQNFNGGVLVLYIMDAEGNQFSSYAVTVYPILSSSLASSDFIFISLEQQQSSMDYHVLLAQRFFCNARSITECSLGISNLISSQARVHFEVSKAEGMNENSAIVMLNNYETSQELDSIKINHESGNQFPLMVISNDGSIKIALEEFSGFKDELLSTLFTSWGISMTSEGFLGILQAYASNGLPFSFQWMDPFSNTIKYFLSSVSRIVYGDNALYILTPVEMTMRDSSIWCSRQYTESCGVAKIEALLAYAAAQSLVSIGGIGSFEDYVTFLRSLSLVSGEFSLLVFSQDLQTIAFDSIDESLVGKDVSSWDISGRSSSNWFFEDDSVNLFDLPTGHSKYAMKATTVKMAFGDVTIASAMGNGHGHLVQPCNYLITNACSVNNVPKIAIYAWMQIKVTKTEDELNAVTDSLKVANRKAAHGLDENTPLRIVNHDTGDYIIAYGDLPPNFFLMASLEEFVGLSRAFTNMGGGYKEWFNSLWTDPTYPSVVNSFGIGAIQFGNNLSVSSDLFVEARSMKDTFDLLSYPAIDNVEAQCANIAVDVIDDDNLYTDILSNLDSGRYTSADRYGGFKPFIIDPKTNKFIASAKGWTGDDVSDHIVFEIPMDDNEVFGMTRKWLKASVKGDDDVWTDKALFMLVVTVWNTADDMYHTYQIFSEVIYDFEDSLPFCRPTEINGCIVPHIEHVITKVIAEIELASSTNKQAVIQTILTNRDFIGTGDFYAFRLSDGYILGSSTPTLVGTTLPFILSLNPALSDVNSDDIVTTAYDSCIDREWGRIPWSNYAFTEKIFIRAHFSCVMVGDEVWAVTAGVTDVMSELFLPCANLPKACTINNAEIIATYIKMQLSMAKTDEAIQAVIDEIDNDFHSFLNIDSGYEIDHMKPEMFNGGTGKVLRSPHEIIHDTFWDHHAYYHNRSPIEAKEDFHYIKDAARAGSTGGWAHMHVRHDTEDVVVEWAVFAQAVDDIVIAIVFQNLLSPIAQYASLEHPEPSNISVIKQRIGEVSTSLDVYFDRTVELINSGSLDHFLVEPFAIDYDEQTILASGSDKLRGQKLEDVFQLDTDSVKDRTFFLSGTDKEATESYLNENHLFQYSDHITSFTDLDLRVYYGAEHASVVLIKKSMLSDSVAELLDIPQFHNFHDSMIDEYVPMIAFSSSMIEHGKLYFMVSLMPLALPIQSHDCDYHANTNCNRVDTQFLMLKMSYMLELSRTEAERDFALDYFSYGFNTEDQTKSFGGTDELHNTYTMIFKIEEKYPIVRHCSDKKYSNMTSDDYATLFMIDTNQDLATIFSQRAAYSDGSYFRFSFGETAHSFIGLAKQSSSVIDNFNPNSGVNEQKNEMYVLVTAYPDIDTSLNPFCDGSYNQLCTLRNVEYSLGSLQSMILPTLDESDGDFMTARLSATYDRTNRIGRLYGMEAELIDDEANMLVSYDHTVLGTSYYETYDDGETVAAMKESVDAIIEEMFEVGMSGDEIASYAWGMDQSKVAYLSYMGYQMVDRSANRVYANMVSYYDKAVPLIPVHSLEIEREYVSLRSIWNIRSFIGDAVHYLLKGRGMDQIGELLSDAREVGLKPFMILWSMVDGMEVPHLAITNRVMGFPTDSFLIDGTDLLKLPVPLLIQGGMLSAEQWNTVSLQVDGWQWSYLKWGGDNLFGNFFRTFNPDNGERVTFGFSSKNEIQSYDESCPLSETRPCSEGTMDAMLSLVARDVAFFDSKVPYTLGSNDLLRPSGDMGIIVWISDSIVVFNSISETLSGETLTTWAIDWDLIEARQTLTKEMTIRRSFSGLESRLPMHTFARLSKGGPLELMDCVFGSVMTRQSQMSVLSFHMLKSVTQHEEEYRNGTSLAIPDECPSFMAHSCSYDYAEFLVARAYEGVVHAYLDGDFKNTTEFDSFLEQATQGNMIKSLILPDHTKLKDFAINIVNSKSTVVASIYSVTEQREMLDLYNNPIPDSLSSGINFANHLTDSGRITRLNDKYDVMGIPVQEELDALREFGCLPDASDRWIDFDFESNDLLVRSVRQHSKTFLLDNEVYYFFIDASGIQSNPKCSEGCGDNSHCAADGMFCVCNDNAVLVNESDYTCELLHVIQDPAANREFLYIAFGICVFITMMISILLFVKRKTRLMRLSSHMITQVVLLGVIMLYFGGLSFALPPEKYPSVCWQRPFWLVGGLTVALLALFLKTWRIQRLVNNIKMKKMKLHNGVLVKYMAIVMIPAAIILTLWLTIYYPDFGYFETYELEYHNPSYAVCSERNPIAAAVGLYLVIIMIWGGYNAKELITADQLPIGANEGSAILKTLFVFFTCGLIFVPLNYMVEDSNQELMVIIRGFGSLACAVSVLIAIVGHKVVWLLRGMANDEFLTALNMNSNRKGSMLKRIGGYKQSGTHTHSSGSRSRNSKSTRYTRDMDSMVNMTTKHKPSRIVITKNGRNNSIGSVNTNTPTITESMSTTGTTSVNHVSKLGIKSHVNILNWERPGSNSIPTPSTPTVMKDTKKNFMWQMTNNRDRTPSNASSASVDGVGSISMNVSHDGNTINSIVTHTTVVRPISTNTNDQTSI